MRGEQTRRLKRAAQAAQSHLEQPRWNAQAVERAGAQGAGADSAWMKGGGAMGTDAAVLIAL